MWLNSGKLITGRLGWDYLQFEANLSCIAASILKMPQIQSPFPSKKSPPTLSIGTKYHSQIGFYALQVTVFVEVNPFQIHCIPPIVFLLDSVLRFLSAYFGVRVHSVKCGLSPVFFSQLHFGWAPTWVLSLMNTSSLHHGDFAFWVLSVHCPTFRDAGSEASDNATSLYHNCHQTNHQTGMPVLQQQFCTSEFIGARHLPEVVTDSAL